VKLSGKNHAKGHIALQKHGVLATYQTGNRSPDCSVFLLVPFLNVLSFWVTDLLRVHKPVAQRHNFTAISFT